MKPFLQSVAEGYLSRYGTGLARCCFIFPNKRSGAFFLKYLGSAAGKYFLAPEVTTVSDLVADLSGRTVGHRLDLLFRLFLCYSKQNSGKTEFDSFRSWGETVLSDFNEVDMQLVDPEEIFRNVKDFREIASDYLNEEQKEVMEQYFGYSGPRITAERFWREFAPAFEGRKDEMHHTKQRFLYLWQMLGPLYREFQTNLSADGLTTTGGAYRLAYQRLADARSGDKEACASLSRSKILRFSKIVFVGFNALSRSEQKILELLFSRSCTLESFFSESFVDCVWDAAGPLFQDADNPAAHFISMNRRKWPEPEWLGPWLKQSVPAGLPEEITVNSTPSNSAQLKVLSRLLSELMAGKKISGKGKKDENPEKILAQARIAVVLPDESLLQPLLYSLGPELGSPNLTMGYPLRQTAVVSFMSLLRRLHGRRSSSSARPGYLYDDVRLLLAHPYSQMLFGTQRISALLAQLKNDHKMVVPDHDLAHLGNESKSIFAPLPPDSKPSATVDYMIGVLETVSGLLANGGNALLKGKLEQQHIAVYCDALRILRRCFDKYRVAVSGVSVFLMADRLIAQETVAFEGEPLRGLQVMGMLETRALDFDYVFIPSLNDRVMPRRGRSRTFIPDTLRRGYGMPPANYQESIFAYYFFRLLSRTSHACLLYDSRTGDVTNGGISRYLLQLQHLCAPGKIRLHDWTFPPPSVGREPRAVKKSAEIREILTEFTQAPLPRIGGKRAPEDTSRNLSASALTSYTKCPLQFFFKYVLRLNDENEITETLDPIAQGNVIHETLLNLYLPSDKQGVFLAAPMVITKPMIDDILTKPTVIEHYLRRAVNHHHFHKRGDGLDDDITGSPALLMPLLKTQVEGVLRRDMKMTPFRLYGCEVAGVMRMPTPDGRKVNMRYAIDRIDRGMEDDAPFRIVDYKTGNTVHLEADSLEDVFSGNYKGSNILQLYLYAMILRQLIREQSDESLWQVLEKGVRMEIYHILKIGDNTKNLPKILQRQETDTSLAEEFRRLLDGAITSILDEETAFSPCSNSKTCTYCRFAPLCRR